MPPSSTRCRARAGRAARSRRGLRWIVAVSLASALAAGCSGSEEGSRPASTTTAPAPATTTTRPAADESSTTTTTPSPEAAILAAVDGYWRVLLESSHPPDPNHPDLARGTLTGSRT